jgi:hypothetical protein
MAVTHVQRHADAVDDGEAQPLRGSNVSAGIGPGEARTDDADARRRQQREIILCKKMSSSPRYGGLRNP